MTVAILLTFLNGLSRVYLGVHWRTDVLVGWRWRGLGDALLADCLALQRRGEVEGDPRP